MRNGLDDKLLLLSLIVFLIGVSIYLHVTNRGDASVAWAQQSCTGVIGALLGIMTGAKKQEINADRGGTVNNSPPSEEEPKKE